MEDLILIICFIVICLYMGWEEETVIVIRDLSENDTLVQSGKVDPNPQNINISPYQEYSDTIMERGSIKQSYHNNDFTHQ